LESLSSGTSTLIYPGNNAQCLNNYSPFFFEVFPGKIDRVVILFNGLGFCSNAYSIETSLGHGHAVCATIPYSVNRQGIFDVNDPRNRFRDYTIINIPDCAGDFFVGNTQVKGSYGVYNQTGGNNVLSVLRWMAIQARAGTAFDPIENLVIVGTSYGSIGAQLWANFIVSYLDYPMRSAVVLDSFAGLFPVKVGTILSGLGACQLPLWSAEYKSKCGNSELELDQFLSDQLQASPNIPFVFIHSVYDVTQISIYNTLAVEHGAAEITEDDFTPIVMETFEGYTKNSNFILYLINSDLNGYFGTSYLYTANYDGESILSTISFDQNINLWTDSLNRWLGHLPLMIGERLYSQCGSNELCLGSSVEGTYYLQKDTSGYMLQKEQEGLTSSSVLVRLINSIPRYGTNLQRVKHDFVNGDPMADRDGYIMSNVAFPLATSSIALVAVFALLLYLLIRYVFSDLAFFSSDNNKFVPDVNREVVVRRAIEYTNLVHQIRLYVIIGLVATALGVYGNILITQGVHTGENTLLWLHGEFQNVATESENMYLLVKESSNYLNIASETCPYAAYIGNNLNEYNRNIYYFGMSASYLAVSSLRFDELLHEWGYQVRIYFVWAVYCVATLILVLFGISAHRSIKGMLYVAIFLSVLFVVITSVFTFAYMLSLVSCVFSLYFLFASCVTHALSMVSMSCFIRRCSCQISAPRLRILLSSFSRKALFAPRPPTTSPAPAPASPTSSHTAQTMHWAGLTTYRMPFSTRSAWEMGL
jgi:hypothetical protein